MIVESGLDVKPLVYRPVPMAPLTPLSLFGHTGSPNSGYHCKQRLLTIDADLSASPSTPAVFRDVTLIASIRGYEVVAVAPKEMLDSYNTWFHRYGIWDNLTDLVSPDQIGKREITLEIIGGKGAMLTAECLGEVLRHIRP